MTAAQTTARQFGHLAEQLAADYYREQGYLVEAMNFRTRQGEIDVIARKGETLVFAEVKARGANTIAQPCEFVTPAKQKKIILAAKAYLARHHDLDSFVRFDVIEVQKKQDGCDLNWIQNAFSGE
ncbi:MAG: YraN family protein [Ruthenibacterium sp.]